MTADTKELVERYACHGWDIRRGEMKPEPDGEWVRDTDYQALATALEAMERRAETAEAETRRVRKSWSDFADNIRQRELESAEAQVTALKAEVGRLREAIARYGAHSRNCQRPRGPECDCGWDDLRAALKARP